MTKMNVAIEQLRKQSQVSRKTTTPVQLMLTNSGGGKELVSGNSPYSIATIAGGQGIDISGNCDIVYKI